MSADRRVPIHREGLRVVLRILQETIWSMRGADDFSAIAPAFGIDIDPIPTFAVQLEEDGSLRVETSLSPTAFPGVRFEIAAKLRAVD